MNVARTASLSAEESVLGACILEPDALAWLELDDYDFFDLKNRSTWNAMRTVFERDGTVDPTTLEAELVRRNVLDAVGGLQRIGDIALSVPTAANVEHYAAELRRKRVTRDVLSAAGAVQTLVERGVEDEELLAEAQALFARIGVPNSNRVTTLHKLIGEQYDEIQKAAQAKLEGRHTQHGIRSGIHAIDEQRIQFPFGVVSVICGRPGGGKSTLALTVGRNHAALGDDGVTLVSYEDRGAVYARRTISATTKIEAGRLLDGDIRHGDLVPLRSARERLCEETRHFHFVRAHGLRVSRALRIALSLGREKPVRLIVLDYVQNAVRARPGQKKHEAIEEAMQDMQDLAAKQNVAIICVSQLNREVEKRGDAVRMSDMKDGGAIEQCAKLILAVGRARTEEGHVEHGKVGVTVVKRNEGGDTGFTLRVPFDGATARFLDQEWRERA